jgi:CheY-like chemotaxis protein
MNQAKKESVLLIECHPADTQLITNALNNDAQDGLQVENFKKLSEGLERIHKGRVRGVIVDIEMPNGRGVTAFERLRAAAPEKIGSPSEWKTSHEENLSPKKSTLSFTILYRPKALKAS